ncbi:Hypothetical protein R9X50_00545200 [Acrodontium crateriforme]|uniref:Uncharacterized protein n=1 Tax=Acrodontium crateriforme TaxID=150365 RepID=A0AAQ3M7U1_9PEZI|nr:Hypothetical protein R9X50_00545200 [Acrodontium crateriforme]
MPAFTLNIVSYAMKSASLAPVAALGVAGTLNIIVGLYGLICPTDFAAQMVEQFGHAIPRPAVYIMSLQELNMGILTLIVANRPNVHFPALAARVFLHAVMGYVFWQEAAEGGNTQALSAVALGLGAMHTMATLVVLWGRTSEKPGRS